MTLFWILACALVVMALLFVFVPLAYYSKKPVQGEADVDRKKVNLSLHKAHLAALNKQLAAGELDQKEYDTQRLEMERELLQDVDSVEVEAQSRSGIAVPLMFAVVVPLVAFGLYFQLGAIDKVEQKVALQDLSHQQDPAQALAQMEEIVRNYPDDYQTRYMLAGMYVARSQYDLAAEHYRTVIRQTGEQGEPLSQLAQTLFVANNNEMNEEIDSLLRRALAVDPNNTTALGLKGISSYEQGKYSEAKATWEKLLPLTRNPQARDALRAGIMRAREAMGEDISQPEPVGSVLVQIALDESLQTLPPQTRVFVYARPQAQKMPLAILPLTVGDLPDTVMLDDSMIMTEGMKLSDFKQVDIVVRISKNGSVMEPDYEAKLEGVEVGDNSVGQIVVLPKQS